MQNMEEKIIKDTKFDHYNITKQNIQFSFYSILEICQMCRPRVFKSNSNLLVHEMHEQNVMIT